MADEALHVQSVLEELRVLLEPAIPLAIMGISEDGGMELTSPKHVEINSDPQRRLHLPVVNIMAEGPVKYEHRMAPFVTLKIPLTLVVETHAPKGQDDPARLDRYAHDYTRAVDIAMSRSWQSVTGAILYRVADTMVAPPDPVSPRRRYGVVRGEFMVRTTRVET